MYVATYAYLFKHNIVSSTNTDTVKGMYLRVYASSEVIPENKQKSYGKYRLRALEM